MDWQAKKEQLENINAFIGLLRMELSGLQETLVYTTLPKAEGHALWCRQRYLLKTLDVELNEYLRIKGK